MKIAIVTSLNKKLYEYYAHRFFETYSWPFDCYVYHEGDIDDVIDKHSYGTDGKTPFFYRNIHEENPTLKDFINRNENRNQFSTIRGTKNSEIVYGLDFIKDAIRFSYKIYAKTHLMLEGNYDYVFWVDADIVFKEVVNEDIMTKIILPPDQTICYLHRSAPPFYPECGFVGYNLTNKHTQKFVKELRNYYEQDLLFNERQWHDSFVWNRVREKFLSGHPQHDLTGRRKDGHVWPESKIGPYMAHLKGKRKKDAGKDERDEQVNKEYYESR